MTGLSFRERVARRGGGGPAITAEDIEQAEFREIAIVDDQDGPEVARAIFAQAFPYSRLTRVELIRPESTTRLYFVDGKPIAPDFTWIAGKLMREAA